MAAIVSAQTGNWNDTATWVGGVVPGDLDTAEIVAGHTVTITAGSPVTLGTAGATGTVALTIGAAGDAGGGGLVVNADLTLKGDLIHRRNRSVTVAAGVTITFQAAGGVTYKWSTLNDPFVGSAVVDLNGTTGSRITIRAQGGGIGYLDFDAGARLDFLPDFVTFDGLGSASQDALQCLINSDAAQCVGTGLLFKACGIVRFDAATTACTIDLDHVDVRGALHQQALVTQGNNDKTGGTREITNLVLYSATAKEAILGGRDWVFSGVSVNHKVNANGGRRQTYRIFHVAGVAIVLGAPTGQHLIDPNASALIEQSAYVANYNNQHGIVESNASQGLGANICQDCVFDFDGFIGTDTGDSYVPGTNSIFTFRRNILLNKAGHLSFDPLGARATILHNTFYDALPVRPQTDVADPQHIVALRGNLFVNMDSGVTMLHPTGTPGLYQRATTFDCDYNCYFNLTGVDNIIHPVHETRGYLDFPGVDQVSGITCTAGTDGDTVVAAAATFVTSGVQAGDYWFNSTRGAGARILSVDGETQLTLAESITGQVSGDSGEVRRSYWSTLGKKYGDDTAGQHDLNVNPLFRFPTRTVQTWDASNGGPGTLANVIAEVVKLNGWDLAGNAAVFNPAYTLDEFLTYIRAGFTPTISALIGAGSPVDGSLDLGALAVVPPVFLSGVATPVARVRATLTLEISLSGVAAAIARVRGRFLDVTDLPEYLGILAHLTWQGRPSTRDLFLTSGDTGRLDIAFTDLFGDPIPLDGVTLRFTAKRSTLDPDVSAVLRKDTATLGGFAITDVLAGRARVTIRPGDTVSLTDPTLLHWDVEMSQLDGSIATPARGRLYVLPGVTLGT